MAALRLPRLEPRGPSPHRPRHERSHDHAAVVLPDSDGRVAEGAGPQDRACHPGAPAGRYHGVRRPGRARSRAASRCWRACARSPWSTRRAAPFPTSHASMPAPSSWCAIRACSGVVGRSRSSSSRRSGATTPSPRTGRPPIGSTASRIGPSRPSPRACATASTTTEFDVQTAMMEWFAEEGLTTDHPPIVATAGERRQPALPAAGHRVASDRQRSRSSCSTCGASCRRPGAVYADISWMGYTGASAAGAAGGRLHGRARRTGCRGRAD